MTPIERLRALGQRHVELWKAAKYVDPPRDPMTEARLRSKGYHPNPPHKKWKLGTAVPATPRPPTPAPTPPTATTLPTPAIESPAEEPTETTFPRPKNVTGVPTASGITFERERGWVLPPGDQRVVRSFPEWYEDHVRARLGKLVKRAEKLGVPPPTLEVVGYEVHRKGPPKKPAEQYTERHITVAITARPVRLGGYTFAGTIQHERGGNIIRGVPGAGEIPVEYRTAEASWCDHCKTTRDRQDTFVVKATDGSFLRVGRNCLADFIGSKDGTKVADLYTDLDDVTGEESDWGSGPAGGGSHLVTEFVAQARNVVRQMGYVSKKMAQDYDKPSTYDTVSAIFVARARPTPGNAYLRTPEFVPTDEDTAFAERAIEWARTQSDPSDYGHNLRIATKDEWMTRRTGGLVTSIVAAYSRHVGESLRGAGRGDRLPARHFGAVGDKIGSKKGAAHPPLTVKVLGAAVYEGTYGFTTLVRMEHEVNGVRYPLVWRASDALNLDPGTYTLTGTIKRHGDFRGTPQTELTRCKLTPVPEEEEG